MLLNETKEQVAAIAPRLAGQPFVELGRFERNGRPLHVALTDRLRRIAQRDRVWQSRPFLTALKNAGHGFDPDQGRSAAGRDGTFLLDRDFRPPNEMMRRIFDRYLDRPGSGVEQVAAALGTTVSELRAVRLVSHQMRLLGVLWRAESADWLVLVDYDASR
jgi:hypothetical protein